MPLYFQHTINKTTKLGIWHIQENETFFLDKVPLQTSITHPHKRLQHLAGRYLLQYLFPDFPYAEIIIADTRKPYLPNEQYHFSISHCGNYAAAIVSLTHRVGIDIEIPSDKVQRIAHKFIHKEEQQYLRLTDDQQTITESLGERSTVNGKLLTILWSAKEALFKWYSLGKVDFKENMQLINTIKKTNDNLLLPFVFKKDEPVYMNIVAAIFEDIVLSWVV